MSQSAPVHRILVLGAAGLLGRRLTRFLVERGHEVYGQVRKAGGHPQELVVETIDTPSVLGLLRRTAADVVINTIAATNVDNCERDPLEAFRANTEVVVAIAAALRRSPKPPTFIQISTDHLYSGTGPHAESATAPINTYALSKYAGELAAASVEATVLRTNFVGRPEQGQAKGLAEWVVSSLRAGVPISGYSDALFAPLDIGTLCAVLEVVLLRPAAGTYNLGARSGCSKDTFIRELAGHLGLSEASVTSTLLARAASGTRRPLDTRMTVGKFERQFAINLPAIESVIAAVANEYGEARTK